MNLQNQNYCYLNRCSGFLRFYPDFNFISLLRFYCLGFYHHQYSSPTFYRSQGEKIMFSHIKFRHQQSSLGKNFLFSLVLVPSVIASSGITTYAHSGQLSNTQAKIYLTLAQNVIAFRFASFWQRQPKKPKVVRGGDICPISPGLADTYIIWSNQPLFLWENHGEKKEAELLIRDCATKEIVWKQPVKTGDEKASYSGTTALVAGKTTSGSYRELMTTGKYSKSCPPKNAAKSPLN